MLPSADFAQSLLYADIHTGFLANNLVFTGVVPCKDNWSSSQILEGGFFPLPADACQVREMKKERQQSAV